MLVRFRRHRRGTRAARARVSRVAGARRALQRRGALAISRGSSSVAAAGSSRRTTPTRARDISVQYGVEKNQDYIPITWVAGASRAARARAGGVGASAEALRGADRLPSASARRRCRDSSRSGAETRRRPPSCLGKADRQASGTRMGCAGRASVDGRLREALLELGRIDDAVRVIDVWEADATRLDRARVLAHVTRCRGLVAAAQGDVERVALCSERAVDQHDEVGDPFGRARALLALGVVLQTRTAEARRPRGDRGRARRLRAARGGDLGREGAQRARADRRADARGRADGRRATGRGPRRRGSGRTGRSPPRSSSPSERSRAT